MIAIVRPNGCTPRRSLTRQAISWPAAKRYILCDAHPAAQRGLSWFLYSSNQEVTESDTGREEFLERFDRILTERTVSDPTVAFAIIFYDLKDIAIQRYARTRQ